MDNGFSKQPSEGSHSVPLQRLADVALRVELMLNKVHKNRAVNDFYKLEKTTEAVIELARAMRALSEYYA